MGGIMSQNFKKWLEKTEAYNDHSSLKHKHNYLIKHLLVVTNINEHASSNYFKKKEYYYVLKCSQCNSFVPDSIDGNYQHNIFNIDNIDNSLPRITANTMQKCPIYNFSKLIDVKLN